MIPAAGVSQDMARAVGLLNNRNGRATIDQQLEAYTTLADRWRGAREPERATLARALTESPFGQKVNATLNSFTRAAWAGADAPSPAPQIQSLAAFDKLPAEGQQIVAAMQFDAASGVRFASPDAYRAKLQNDVDVAVAAERKTDTVTLSDEAKAFLAGIPAQGDAAAEAAPAPPRPDLGPAFDAYAKAARAD